VIKELVAVLAMTQGAVPAVMQLACVWLQVVLIANGEALCRPRALLASVLETIRAAAEAMSGCVTD